MNKIINIGRSENNQIQKDHYSVSREHAKILIDGSGNVSLEDLNSRNGTFVNNVKIKHTQLKSSDIVRIGSVPLDITEFFKTNIVQNKDNRSENTIIKGSQEIKKGDKLYKVITVGRNSANDIVINNLHVSSNHAEFIISGNDIILKDKNSLNGTFVNKERITEQKVEKSDVIYFGSFKFNFESFNEYFGETKDLSQLSLKLKEGVNSIGRASDNDIVVTNPMVSKHHAKIYKSGNNLDIEDIGSLNGVFINGQRITGKVKININDVINLGIYPLRLSESKVIRSYKSDGRIDLQNLSYAVKDKDKMKVILNEVSLTIYPSEFVGLIGPSGSGKTTLLNLMNGYSLPTKGNVIINSFNLHQNQNLFRGMIGFVPQDDIIHRELTVFESLYYSAKLRLPSDTSEQEILFRVNEIIDKLEISKAKNTRIGSPEKKGISGGQRKRVNLAQELITQPSILFLDEPTSGLDPLTDFRIMELLRNIADEGKIVVLTTHHITKENFEVFNNMVLLAEGGKTAYYGPAYPEMLDYYKVNDPKQIFHSLEAKSKKADPLTEYRKSRYFKEYVNDRILSQEEIYRKQQNPGAEKNINNVSAFKQLFIFLSRLTKIKISDKENTLILLLQAPILALLIGFTLQISSDYKGTFDFMHALNVMVITAIFFGIINTSREIVAEKAIYLRERKIFLKVPPYLFSKFSLLTIISFFQSFSLVFIIHLMCGLKYSVISMTLIVFLTSVSSMCLGLLISSIAKSADSSISLSIFALIPQIIYAGAIVPLKHMWEPVKIISYFCLSRWSYESLLMKEAGTISTFTIKVPQPDGTKIDSVVNMVSHLSSDKAGVISNPNNFTGNLVILAMWGIVYLVIVVYILKMRDKIK